ncbi:hypothetical protein PR048_014079 [Dryococelus australis]|uniref:Secreted protein n=1 Tax=Dryococelus australis TaxID=614101 RepID=A0ABQ9HU40_9NEOP|nr:hypothetical protein PR048_014079 [Dryococelus australis]
MWLPVRLTTNLVFLFLQSIYHNFQESKLNELTVILKIFVVSRTIVIDPIPANEKQNFVVAWQLLKKRFNTKRLIVSHH